MSFRIGSTGVEAEGTKVLDIGNANPRNEEALDRSRNKYHSAAHPRRGVSVVEGGCGGTAYDGDRGQGHRDPLELPCTGNSSRRVLAVARPEVVNALPHYP